MAIGRTGSNPSVGAVLDRTKGIGQGFNFLRIALSVAVIFVHSFQAAYGFGARSDWLGTGPLGPPVAAVLVMFFGLSGFLVTGSAIRTGSLRTFLSFRGLRLVPALFVEVVLSGFLLGALITTLSPGDYFTRRELFVYFGNIVGWIHYTLPGVFASNPNPLMVNRSLWTLHPELECYAIMSLLILTRTVTNRTLITAGWIALTAGLSILDFFITKFALKGNFPGPVLVYYFISGIVAYHWRYRIPVSRTIFAVSCLSAYLLLKLPHTGFVAVFPLMYIMIYVGLTPFRKWSLIERGDYSYGMYLYGYPVQQTLAYLSPALREWWIIFPLAVLLSYGIAAVSWHLVEKPALKLKARLGGKVMQAPPAPPAAPAEPRASVVLADPLPQ